MATSTITVRLLGDNKGLAKAFKDTDSQLAGLGKKLGRLGGAAALAGGAALGAGVLAGVTTAFDRADLSNQLANNLGLTDAQATEAGRAAAEVYGQGFAANFEEALSITSTLAGLGVADLENATRQASAITETFAVDQAELLAATNSLIQRGLAKDAEDAFNQITAAAEGSFIPLAEQLDLVSEYGDQIAQVGITGEEAFGLISGAASSFEADKILDSFKELAIRGQDMSDTSVGALEALGLNAESVATAFGNGGQAAADARNQIIAQLEAIEDPIERNRLGVALMGTAIEDLGADPLDKLDAIGSSLDGTAGAADKLAKNSLTVRDRFGALGRRGENALAKLGEAVLPFIERHMPTLETALDTAIGFMETNLPKAISATETAFETLEPFITAVFDGVSGVIGFFAENEDVLAAAAIAIGVVLVGAFVAQAAAAYTSAAAAYAAAGGMIAFLGPVNLIIIAGAALAAGLFLLYQRSETFRTIIDTIAAFLKDDLLPIVENVVSWVGDKLASAFTTVRDFIKNRAIPAVEDIIGFFGDLIDKAGDVRDGVTDKIGEVVDFIKDLPGEIRRGASGAFDGLSDAFRSAINSIIRGWNSLSFSLPAVSVPGLGEIGGFTLNTPNIALLAGGAVFDRPTLLSGRNGGNYMVAEYPGAGRNREIVTPERLLDERIAAGLAPLVAAIAGMGNRGPTVQIDRFMVPPGRTTADELNYLVARAG